MKTTLTLVLVGLIGVGVLSGCSMGMQPEGPNVEALKKKEDSLPPDQQISMIEHAPMPEAQKAQKIAEIKTKYNIK